MGEGSVESNQPEAVLEQHRHRVDSSDATILTTMSFQVVNGLDYAAHRTTENITSTWMPKPRLRRGWARPVLTIFDPQN